tara:strand:- start:128 stop:316 length:189 start_codon:yes stop_codon:yes gene_type:complete
MDRLLLIYFWTSIFAFIVSLVGLGLLISVATDLNIIENHIDTIYTEIEIIKDSQIEILHYYQ